MPRGLAAGPGSVVVLEDTELARARRPPKSLLFTLILPTTVHCLATQLTLVLATPTWISKNLVNLQGQQYPSYPEPARHSSAPSPATAYRQTRMDPFNLNVPFTWHFMVNELKYRKPQEFLEAQV